MATEVGIRNGLPSAKQIAVLLFALAALGPIIPAHAGIEDARRYLQSGEREEAEKELLRLAEARHMEARYLLAELYFNPRFEKCDPNFAIFWYRKAADQGHETASMKLADMYRRGKLVPRDPKRAARHYAWAANLGNASAKLHLGQMYLAGEGGDITRGVNLVRRVAREYPISGTSSLGGFFLGGGPPYKDLEGERSWYRHFHVTPVAALELAKLLQTGRGIPKDEHKAFQLVRQAAENWDHAPAMRKLADFYAMGVGVAPDATLAEVWRQKAVGGDRAMGASAQFLAPCRRAQPTTRPTPSR